jgi:hypothetical protein
LVNTRKSILTWIHDNLGATHKEVAEVLYADYWVSEGLLGGIVCREYGFLIPKKVNQGKTFEQIIANAWGDGGHGASIYQIDDRSFPDFIKAHPLSDVRAYCIKAVEVLKEKERYLVSKGYTREKLGDETFERAVISAYNCGQGNVSKALARGLDVDRYTYGGDYSKDVQISRYLYWDLFIAPNLADKPTDTQLSEAKAGIDDVPTA